MVVNANANCQRQRGEVQPPLVSEAVDRPGPPELHIQPDFFFLGFENILSHSTSALFF
jgi:hypothetical protein